MACVCVCGGCRGACVCVELVLVLVVCIFAVVALWRCVWVCVSRIVLKWGVTVRFRVFCVHLGVCVWVSV